MKTQTNSKLRRMKIIPFYLIVLLMFIITPTQNFFAASPSDSIRTGENNLNVHHSTAPVKFEGKVLFYVRGITSFPAEERARIIAERIKNIAKNYSINTASLRVEELADRSNVLAGKDFIVSILDTDAEIEGLERQFFP
ncbi:MAG: hypothetical protein U5J96_07960 [Ignavibacteriaceae bacterium]|nr:hypothetical protein [Ignavibacteriaceae bacterium]